MIPNLELALDTFERAYTYIEKSGLLSEVEWQHSRSFPEISESDLLRESAWVILCTGFREAIVSKLFDQISLSFCDWESCNVIITSAPACRTAAMASFRNERKLDAIIRIAHYINEAGFESLKSRIAKDPIQELQKLPYIGPVTVWHLAKNLGFNVAKPDRHLVRLCSQLGYASVIDLCEAIAAVTGNPVSVVDIVLWRYLANAKGTSRQPNGFAWARADPPEKNAVPKIRPNIR